MVSDIDVVLLSDTVDVSTNIIRTSIILSILSTKLEKETSFNPVIISSVETKMARPEFVVKVKAKMAEQNLGIRDLARKLGVSHPTVTELVTYGKKPSFDTCVAISKWLGQSPVSILQEAGLLPPQPEADEQDGKISHRTQNMSPEQKRAVLAFINSLEAGDIQPATGETVPAGKLAREKK